MRATAESMKIIAPCKGFSGYQALLKSYISECLRRDEAQFELSKETKLITALPYTFSKLQTSVKSVYDS